MSAMDTQIIRLIQLHAPIKARKLATILADEFGKHVDRSDVNSALYRMKSEGKVEINKNYEWLIAGAVGKKRLSTQAKTKQSVTPEVESTSASIEFTPEQQAVINLDPTQHLLIRGQAGSGKTTVLAARANKILSAMNKGSVLFLTYNAALCAYVKKSFSKMGMKSSIEAKTFHDWSKSAAISLGAHFNGWVDGKERKTELVELIGKARKEVGDHRLFNPNDTANLLEWWGEEIAWLFGQHILRLEDYLLVERVGRGTAIRVSQEDRRFVWIVFELYQEWLEESRREDYDNPAGLLLRTLEEQNKDLPDHLRFDHVMVDEVQDFDKSWLLAVVKIPRVSLSLAGDLAQKIYRRNFTWSSVGIQVQGGRSKKLAASHRTTQQIMNVAEYLLANNDVVDSPDFTPPVRPSKNGEPVKLLMASTPPDAYERGYDWIAKSFKRLRTSTVAVVLPFSRQLYPAKKSLEKRKLKVKVAKGGSLGSTAGGVVVTTFHQLKGLEFDHVVIMGLHDAQYPGRLLEGISEEDQNDEIQLMRRVLYVAMTRAKQTVTLVGAKPFCRFFDDVPSSMFSEIT
ncbi:3'-5' exonuclease [Pseudidiomarina donghaiensis]|uniref:DNA 3'-5' helicase n=1 Tax=Pseudidiomarina donghaiensis TaxID=519452 RepID=A0A432XBC4_9GAMM|nr:3'-5' exonuclease [Pseudidiomarina donghaiensis]RUO45950.1 ATP-dependent helicase [Pseudidiomarina donghaiensis]SFV25095.1 UvrD/REP helicase N-terminal domain-containing protein [Pseudidiomarina donghaiensis]